MSFRHFCLLLATYWKAVWATRCNSFSDHSSSDLSSVTGFGDALSHSVRHDGAGSGGYSMDVHSSAGTPAWEGRQNLSTATEVCSSNITGNKMDCTIKAGRRKDPIEGKHGLLFPARITATGAKCSSTYSTLCLQTPRMGAVELTGIWLEPPR